jgi:ABC-type transport system involved in multi-copper enzyme maturation permease subunit
MGTGVIVEKVSVSRARQAHGWVMSTSVIAGLTFKEAARRKILWAALLLGLAFLALYSWGLHALIKSDPGAFSRDPQLVRRQAVNFSTMMGLYAVNYLTVLMTVLTSVDTLAGEISSGTIQAVVTKPMSRWQVVLGKWLGFVGMLTMYLTFMAGGVLVATFLLSGYAPRHILQGLSLMWLESLLLLSVTFLWGTSFSTLTTGVLTVGLQGLAFIGSWIEQFGAMTRSQTAVNIGVVSSLIMPSEALWRRAAFEMQSPLVSALGVSPFAGASVPSVAMIIYAGIYMAVAFGLAIRWFGQRDL